VKAGDIVTVRVVDVDAGRKRIALTMKSGETKARTAPGTAETVPKGDRSPTRPRTASSPRPKPAPSTALAAAFAKLSGKA
jgi:uncharacterized protein